MKSIQTPLLTGEMAIEAVQLYRPMIEGFLGKYPDRVAAHVVVLDPSVPLEEAVESAILYQETFGEKDRSKWPQGREYDMYALHKAALSRDTGLPGHIVIRDRPHLLSRNDFKYPGSENRNDIVVATSGLKYWWEDYIISAGIASALQSICIGNAESELAKAGDLFFGGHLKILER
jgi:hypothetical protein